MKDFGLAGEGVTDQIVLENVLFGLYDGVDDFEFDVDEIAYLQPFLDATDEDGLGGWSRLHSYLENKRFRDDVVNHRFIIIQVDTDVAADVGFDVVTVDESNRALPVDIVVENVQQRLVQQIDAGKEGFYEEHQASIVFAITVHSLECWLFNLHNNNPNHFGRVLNCESHLIRILSADRAMPRFIKNRDYYDGLSKQFYGRAGTQKIAEVANVDTSFRIFIEDLKSLPYPP